MWLINKLSYTYQTRLNIPVQLVNSNVHEFITEGSKSLVHCYVRARGYDLMLYKMYTHQGLQVDVAQHTTIDLTQNERGFMARSLQTRLVQNLGSTFELVDIQQDTIKFRANILATKKVPIRSRLRTVCAPQYIMQQGVQLLPDSVIISGVQADLDNIEYIATKNTLMNKVNKSSRGKVALIAPKNEVILSLAQVGYKIDVVRITEVQKKMTVQCKNLPQNVEIQMFPSANKVLLCVDMEYYKELEDNEIQLFVDYNDVAGNLSGQLAVQLDTLPHYILSANVERPFVRFVLAQTQPQ
ncbi:hypothetical protein AGMMS4956_17560 [Bacteroidia bacterium]|nr:hypothetical protein AGMMS4956_17560 [Bacteroidia bacterium]